MPPKPARDQAQVRSRFSSGGGGAEISFRPQEDLRAAAASGFNAGDAIEYNSMSHGGWMPAYVDTVYADGKLRLLAEPDRGGPRARQTVLKDRVAPEEHLVRHRRPRGSATPQPRDAGGGAFSVGQHVEYLSQSKQTLIRCIVAKVHRDGAVDLDREDGLLHTRADPSLVQAFSRGGGGAGGEPPLRRERGTERQRALERVTQQAEADRLRERTAAAARGGALSAAIIAEAKARCTHLMTTGRKERTAAMRLEQADRLLDLLESEFEALGVVGGPRHPDLANMVDNFISWLQTQYIDGADHRLRDRRRALSRRCTKLATPLDRVPAGARPTARAAGGGGGGGGEYGALHLEPDDTGDGAAMASDYGGYGYDSTPAGSEAGSSSSSGRRGRGDVPTDRGRPEPSGVEIEISQHPIAVVNGLYQRGSGYHGGYPFYSKALTDGTAIYLFFSDEYKSWFLSRSPTMDVKDMLYVGRLALEAGWERGASHLQWQANASIALPSPPLGHHPWRCQTRWVLSADQRPEPIEASLLITQRHGHSARQPHGGGAAAASDGYGGVRRDLTAELDSGMASGGGGGGGRPETDAERQRRRDRERAATTRPAGGGGATAAFAAGGGGAGGVHVAGRSFTPRAAAAETVRQAAEGMIDDETALIELLEAEDLRRMLDGNRVGYSPTATKAELKRLAHDHRQKQRRQQGHMPAGTAGAATGAMAGPRHRPAPARPAPAPAPAPAPSPAPRRRVPLADDGRRGGVGGGGGGGGVVAEGLPPARPKKIVEMQSEICHHLGIHDGLDMTPLQLCSIARAELGMPLQAAAGRPLVENIAEIMAGLGLPTTK